jgi:putative transposase
MERRDDHKPDFPPQSHQGLTEHRITRGQARADVFFYIESFYNRRRRHSALDYLGPQAYEQLYYQRLALA